MLQREGGGGNTDILVSHLAVVHGTETARGRLKYKGPSDSRNACNKFNKSSGNVLRKYGLYLNPD